MLLSLSGTPSEAAPQASLEHPKGEEVSAANLTKSYTTSPVAGACTGHGSPEYLNDRPRESLPVARETRGQLMVWELSNREL